MYYKYNAVLRKFPSDAYETCRVINKGKGCSICYERGNLKKVIERACACYNTYPTTINAILSGLRKLMWKAPLPKDRFVYRGLSDMDLPEQFFKQDINGVRGGTEYGMMSTSVRSVRGNICNFESLFAVLWEGRHKRCNQVH